MKPRFLHMAAFVACMALAASCGTEKPAEELPGILINGVRWAPSNVDAPGTFAAGAADPGMYYQWGRPTGWSFTDPLISSPAGEVWNGVGAGGEAWRTADDPCPAGWRMPTQRDFARLLDTGKVGYEWIGKGADHGGDGDGDGGWDTRADEARQAARADGGDGAETSPAGMEFTDKSSGKSVFFPAAGYRYRDEAGQRGVGGDGFYWSSVADGELPGGVDPGVAVFCLYFHSDVAAVPPRYIATPARPDGFTVRCVAEL